MARSNAIFNAGVFGLSLFALFFGAGNLIFPPVIGLEGGSDWVIGYLAYFLADVGLALLGFFAMLKTEGDLDGVTGVIGKVPSAILNCAVVLCVGPLLAMPRTAATSFEMATEALAPGLADDSIARAVFSVAFFVIVFFAVLHPGKVVDSVGKYLTPLLVVALIVLIVAGIVSPGAQTASPRVDTLFQEGMVNGFQTMDMIAALVFSLVVVSSIGQTAENEGISRSRLAFSACVIAALLLFLTYGGLAYLGATTGQLWGDAFMAGEIDHAQLLSNISSSVLGNAGAIILSTVVVLACLTTAIGLASACSKFVVSLSKDRFSYHFVAIGMCAFSAFVCNLGLAEIIVVSSPILSLVYPTAIFLVLMRLVPFGDRTRTLVCRLGAIASFAVSFCVLLCDTLGVSGLSFIHMLPFDVFGFGWLVPTLAAAVCGYIISRIANSQH